MKKLNLAIALALGLVIPFTVMSSSDNEVNKQAMEMHENTTESVMNRVNLPDTAVNVTEEATERKRLIKKRAGDVESKGKIYAGEQVPGNKYASDIPADGSAKKLKKQTGKAGLKQTEEDTIEQTGQGTGESVGDLDRDRIRDQDMEQIHDMDQDREMDRDQDRSMEMDQDQIRDTDHVFEQDPPMTQDVELDPPMQQEMDQEQNQIDSELPDSDQQESDQSEGNQNDQQQPDTNPQQSGSGG